VQAVRLSSSRQCHRANSFVVVIFHGSYRLSSVRFPGMGLPPSGASLSLMLHNLPPQSGNVKAKLNIYSQNMRFW
jgi:hypothetical protein